MGSKTDNETEHHPKRTAKEFTPELNPDYSVVPSEAEHPEAGQRFAHLAWEIGRTIAIIIIVAFFIIRPFIVQPFVVNGESMQPNFHDNDYLLINEFSYHFTKPARGDVIVFDAPPEHGTNYIKRIVGLPGDTVELKNGNYYVSNAKHHQPTLVKESYVAQDGVIPPTLPESDTTSWQVGKDEYFVSGDNREPDKSSDSRAWGLVPRSNIIGRVSLRVYPPAAFGFTKNYKHPEVGLAGWLV